MTPLDFCVETYITGVDKNYFFKKSPNLVQNPFKIYFCDPNRILNMSRVSKCVLKTFFITRTRFGVRKSEKCQKMLKTVLYDPLGKSEYITKKYPPSDKNRINYSKLPHKCPAQKPKTLSTYFSNVVLPTVRSNFC